MRWWRRFNLGVARGALREARRMFARGDDAGLVVGISMLVFAEKARDAARMAIGGR